MVAAEGVVCGLVVLVAGGRQFVCVWLFVGEGRPYVMTWCGVVRRESLRNREEVELVRSVGLGVSREGVK